MAFDRLVNIIRSLTYGAGSEQLEQEKQRLFKEYKERDKRLDEMVRKQQPELIAINKSYTEVASHISNSQARIRAIKDDLLSCKNLLHCKRDELRKLWLDGIEQKTIVNMLDQVEKVKYVGDELQAHIQRKQYLRATELLVRSLALIDNDLKDVGAMGDLRTELLAKKEELFDILTSELNQQIYTKCLAPVVQSFQRQGSHRSSQGRISAVQTATAKKSSAKSELVLPVGLQQLMSMDLAQISAPQTINEQSNPNVDSEPLNFIAVVIECFALLKKMPEAVDYLRHQMRPGLLGIIHRASQQVYDNAFVEGEDLSEVHQPQYLLEILQLVFAQFRVVARTHEVIMANLLRVKNQVSSLGDFCIYNSLEVWSKIQAVLQMIILEYLDAKHSGTGLRTSQMNFEKKPADLNSYFTKKRYRGKKFLLFRFSASSHALSLDSYMREQRQEVYGMGQVIQGNDMDGKLELVCKPLPSNITVIYIPLKKFIDEMELQMNAASGTSSLSHCVKDFLEGTYLPLINETYHRRVENLTRTIEMQRQTIDLRMQKDLDVPKPLLTSTVEVVRIMEELQVLMDELPDFAEHFLLLMSQIMESYRTMCVYCYQALVSESDEKRMIISGSWAKDEDISRLLRSLPNWRQLKDAELEELSEDDRHITNTKESVTFTSNLSSNDGYIPPQELIIDIGLLRAIGHLVESMEWLSNMVRNMATGLEHSLQKASSNAVAENSRRKLLELSQEVQDLADLGLLVLHIEVRVHCFYHLLPIPQKSNYTSAIDDMDPDIYVVQLQKDMVKMEEALAASLQVRKFRYVFMGLGHLVATILINCTKELRRINENGIRKMCRNLLIMQQCLSTITANREYDLDHVRQYYEMLHLTFDEFLSKVMEEGPKYTEQEYNHLLSLGHRSERGYSGNKGNLEERLFKLQKLLKQKTESI